jgi:hypothetical protein
MWLYICVQHKHKNIYLFFSIKHQVGARRRIFRIKNGKKNPGKTVIYSVFFKNVLKFTFL